jgi:hypothetical protein
MAVRRSLRTVRLTLILGLAACGSSHSRAASIAASPPAASVCPSDVVAQVSRLGGGPVSVRSFLAPNGAHGCGLRIPDGPEVTITIDTASQPYARLERQIVETGQVFGPRRLVPAPVHVDRLGLDASWFPGLGEVLTASSSALVGVGVAWPGQTVRRRRVTAVAIARRLMAEPPFGQR